jgi:serine/threonine-protein kinase
VAKRGAKQQEMPSTIPPAGETLVGRTLDDRYRIDAALGAGGMGAVYRATHLKLGSPVAVKVLLQQYASSSSLRKRFEREAKALAAVRHPNVVSITDYGVWGEVPYLVMELLEGETLSHRLVRAPFPNAQVQELISQLLRALSFVHAQGLVHRDLKPANVFFERLPDGDERLKLLDFGLAKVIEPDPLGSDPHLTAAGEAVGTPAYMAPEQISGGPADAAADVYAVGVLMYQLLCGQLPYRGERMEQLKQHLTAPVPSLSAACPRGPVRPELEALFQRAMAKQRSERFRDAAEMLAALESVPQPWTQSEVEPNVGGGALALASTIAGETPTAETKEVVSPAAGRATAPASKSGASWVGRALLFAVPLILLAVSVRALLRARHPEDAAQHAVAAKPDEAAPPPAQGAGQVAAPPPGEAAEVAPPPAPSPAPEDMVPAPPPASEGVPPAPPVQEPAQEQGSAHESAAPAPSLERENRPKPATPRPPPRNPWARGTPKELRSTRKLADSGNFGNDRTLAMLRKYIRANADDPRGRLLLAQLYVNRHWRADAVSEYAAAYQVDASARGAPRMLADLVAFVAQGSVADEATRVLLRAYGKEAIPTLDRAIAAQRAKSDAKKRLVALRARL